MPPKVSNRKRNTLSPKNIHSLTSKQRSTYMNKIFKELVSRYRPTRDQIGVIIYGTPGAGKTTATKTYLKQQFDSKKRFLVIDRDELVYEFTDYFKVMKKYLKSIGMEKDPNQLITPKNIESRDTNMYYGYLRDFLGQGNLMMNAMIERAHVNHYNIVIYDPPYRFRPSEYINIMLDSGYNFHSAFLFTPRRKIRKHLNSRAKSNLIVLSDGALKRLTTNTVTDFVFMCLNGHDILKSCTVIDNSKNKTEMTQMKDWDFIYRFQKHGRVPQGYEFLEYD